MIEARWKDNFPGGKGRVVFLGCVLVVAVSPSMAEVPPGAGDVSCADNRDEANLNEITFSGADTQFIEIAIRQDDVDVSGWNLCYQSGNDDCVAIGEGNLTVYPDEVADSGSIYDDVNYLVYDYPNPDIANNYGELLLLNDKDKVLDYFRFCKDLSSQQCENHWSVDLSQCGNEIGHGSTNIKDLSRIPDETGSWGETDNPTRGEANAGVVETGDFNAFESTTPSGSTTGPLYTKVAGLSFQVDVVSIGGGGNLKTFNGDVDLELVAAGAGDCADLDSIADLGTATLSGKRTTVDSTTVGEPLVYSGAAAAVGIRITEDKKNPKQGCSTDWFTIRPHHLSLQGQDQDWQNSGTDRVLDGDNSASCQGGGGTEACHKAGYNFSLTAFARDDEGNVISDSYSATANLGWSLHGDHDADDVLGNFSPNSLSFPGDGSGARTDAAVYDEVGLVNLTLNDEGSFASDSGDKGDGHCEASSSSNSQNGEGKYGCRSATSSAQTVGRFVPADFEQTVTAAGELEAACAGAFTYLGQRFGYAVAAEPELEIEARNGDENTTRNYTGDFAKLVPEDVERTAPDEDDSQNGRDGERLEVGSTLQDGVLTDNGDGTLTYTFSKRDEFKYVRDLDRDGDGEIDTRVAPFDADLNIGVGPIEDSDEVTATVLEDVAPRPTEIRFGRLVLGNAHGPETEDLAVPLRAQYYAGSQFTNNGLDSCTPLSRTDSSKVRLELEDGDWQTADTTVDLQGGAEGRGQTKGVEVDSSITDGTAALTLQAPADLGSAGDTGFVPVRANLGTFPYLRTDRDGDGNFDDNPRSRATFGRYQGNDRILFWREVYH